MLSPEYQRQLTEKHAADPDWGTTSHRYTEIIKRTMEKYQVTEILDYGCGKGSLKKSLGFKIKEYDPGIPQKAKKPKPAQFLVCTDVLEHVEPRFLNDVLDDLRRCTKKVALIDVCLVEAVHILPDGRNAHLIVENMEWWLPKLMKRFRIKFLQHTGSNFFIIAE